MPMSAPGLRRRVGAVSLLSICALIVWGVDPTAAAGPKGGGQVQLPGTVEDFFEPGTQEGTLNEQIYVNAFCQGCHSFYDDGNEREVVAPWQNWKTSLMAQSARDPVWHAALHVANNDMANSGDSCIRCHAPKGWLEGRSVPTDGSALTADDLDEINCSFCHRMIDPVFSTTSPAVDGPILSALAKQGLLPSAPGNGRYIVDPDDSRRGPLPYCGDGEPCAPNAVPENWHGSPIYESPYHTKGQLCGACHDVSNPAFTRKKNGAYVLNAPNAAHPTGNPHDMMPEQRTYSEWLNSAFANTGVNFPDGRFGGDHPTGTMSSCQDCHMPKQFGGLCVFWQDYPFFPRPDIPEHGFAGANTWVLGAVRDQYGEGASGLNDERIALNLARVTNMLQAASDMHLTQLGNQLKVRIVNYSGHKLPTGYPEGRRMWLNVKFLDQNLDPIQEHGEYDFGTATLSTGDTKVYEMKAGLDSAMASATNLPMGPSFHLVLNNVIVKDNRIPPIGFNNAAFNAVRAAPVAAAYADGQYWDDTTFAIPLGAEQAVVTLYYQTSSREYMEFLRDNGGAAGLNAHSRWIDHGMSAPVNMDMVALNLTLPRPGDANHDGIVNIDDLVRVITQWGPCPPPTFCEGDVNGTGVINIDDLVLVITNWG